MADRDTAWRALERLFGPEVVRGPGSVPHKLFITRVCGLSDRLTGSWGSAYVLHSSCTPLALALLAMSDGPWSRTAAKDVVHIGAAHMP